MANTSKNLKRMNGKYRQLFESLKHIINCHSEAEHSRKDQAEDGEQLPVQSPGRVTAKFILAYLEKKELKIPNSKVNQANQTKKKKTEEEEALLVDPDEVQKQEINRLINELGMDLKETIEVKINKELRSLATEEESSTSIFLNINDILDKVSKNLA